MSFEFLKLAGASRDTIKSRFTRAILAPQFAMLENQHRNVTATAPLVDYFNGVIRR